MKSKDRNQDYKRWPLIISRVIRIASLLIKTLIPHKNSFEFCLGFWTMKIPTSFKKEYPFLFIWWPQMNNLEFWNPRRLIKVLKSDWWHKNLTLDETLIWVPNGTQWGPIGTNRPIGTQIGPIGTQIGPISIHVKFEYQSALKWIISK